MKRGCLGVGSRAHPFKQTRSFPDLSARPTCRDYSAAHLPDASPGKRRTGILSCCERVWSLQYLNVTSHNPDLQSVRVVISTGLSPIRQ